MLTVTFLLVTLLATTQGQLSSEELINSNETEYEIIEDIENAIVLANNYTTGFLELIVKVARAFIQSGNNTILNPTQLIKSIKMSFNSSNDECKLFEQRNITVLMTNTTESIKDCYKNVSKDIKAFIPTTEIQLVNIVELMTYVTSNISNCFSPGKNFLYMPGCIINLVQNAVPQYIILKDEMNSTIVNGTNIFNNLAKDTQYLMKEILPQFFQDFAGILMSYVACINE